MCREPGLQLYLIVPPFVFCFNRSLVFKSSVSHAAFLRRRPCQQLLFYWLPHDAGVTPIPSLYLSLDTGTPIKSVQHSVPSPLPTMACIRPTQSSVTLIQFPLPACAPCFNSTNQERYARCLFEYISKHPLFSFSPMHRLLLPPFTCLSLLLYLYLPSSLSSSLLFR